MATTGKKLSKFAGLYGSPEAITSSAGVVYCCCNSGTICCWGSRHLGDSDPKFDIDESTSWADAAQLNADALSPAVTMRLPITAFVHTQKAKVENEPLHLNDSLRRYLGAKKDPNKRRPHPILPTRNKAVLQAPTALDTIRRVWLGTNEHRSATIDESCARGSAGSNSAFIDTMNQPEDMKLAPKLLKAADFDPGFSSGVPARARALAVTSPPHEKLDLSAITTSSMLSEQAASEDLGRSVQSSASSARAAGKFFLRAKEYLRSRHIVPTTGVDDAPQHQNFLSQHRSSDVVEGSSNGLKPDDSFVNWTHVSSAWGAKPVEGSSNGFKPDDSFVNWTHVSSAWGAKPKRM